MIFLLMIEIITQGIILNYFNVAILTLIGIILGFIWWFYPILIICLFWINLSICFLILLIELIKLFFKLMYLRFCICVVLLILYKYLRILFLFIIFLVVLIFINLIAYFLLIHWYQVINQTASLCCIMLTSIKINIIPINMRLNLRRICTFFTVRLNLWLSFRT